MEDRVEVTILLDLYSNLLTEKQREIMELYFYDDLSLAEIAENSNTSRQAIHDVIKRCHKLLLQYEEKLGLMQKSKKLRQVKENIIDRLNLLESYTNDENRHETIEYIKSEIIENF